MTSWKAAIAAMKPCPASMEWLRDYDDPERAWRECERGDWLLWLAGSVGVDRNAMVLAACDCAEPVLRYVSETEDRPRRAIETARAWARGDSDLDAVVAAGLAAEIACRPAGLAALATVAAGYAGDAARAAARAAEAAGDGAYAGLIKTSADVVRGRVPFDSIFKKLEGKK